MSLVTVDGNTVCVSIGMTDKRRVAVHDVLDTLGDSVDGIFDAVDETFGVDDWRGHCVRRLQLERLEDCQSVLEIVGNDIDEVRAVDKVVDDSSGR